MIGILWNQPQTDILVRNFDLRKLSTFVAGVVQDNALPVTTSNAHGRPCGIVSILIKSEATVVAPSV